MCVYSSISGFDKFSESHCLQPTGHNLKWDHFDLLAKGRSGRHCKIKETLLIRELKATLNDKVSSEKLYLYYFAASDMQICLSISVIVIVN